MEQPMNGQPAGDVSAANPGGPSSPQGALAQAAGGGMGQQDLNPQQMQQFKEGFQLARNMLYDKQLFGGLIAGVDKGDPIDTFAAVLLSIAKNVEKKQGEMDLTVLLSLALALLQEIAGAIEGTGRQVPSAEQVEAALGITVKEWLTKNGHRVPPEQMQALMQQGGQPQTAGVG